MNAPLDVIRKAIREQFTWSRRQGSKDRLADALEVAVEALNLIASRGAGPLQHRMECSDALLGIAAILEKGKT